MSETKQYQPVQYGSIEHEINTIRKFIEHPIGKDPEELKKAEEELKKLLAILKETSCVEIPSPPRKSFLMALKNFFSPTLIRKKIEATRELHKWHKPKRKLCEHHRFDNFDPNKQYA